MTINIQDVLLDSTTTFDTWRIRTNEIAAAMRTNVVTVGGDSAVGDAVITGSLSADDLYTTNLWGGSKTAVGNLTVKTNTSFQGQVDAVDIFLTGSLSLLDNTKLIVPGATATAKYLEFDPGTNTPVFVHIPRFQDTTRTNGSILIWNSTTGQYEHNTNILVDSANNNITVNVDFTVNGSIISNSDLNLKKGTETLLHTPYTPGTDGDLNLFIGQGAGNVNVGQGFVNTWEGCNNIGIGRWTLRNVTTGYRNVAVGSYTLDSETTGVANTALGYATLSKQNGANHNTAIGYNSGYSLTTGSYNIAIGSYSLDGETTGNNNTAVGYGVLSSQSGAGYNTAFGFQSGFEVTTGSVNTFLGYNTGRNVTDGSNNTFVGGNIDLGNVSNNIALATGDGTVRFQYDGTQWKIPEKVTWLTHGNAELHFDTPGDVSGGIKRITCNDGGGNWNFRSGCYWNVTNARLEYSTLSQAASDIIINTENTSFAEIKLDVYGPNSTGIAGSPVEGQKTFQVKSDLSYPQFFDGVGWYPVWHQGDIGNRITALPAATPANIAGNESVPISTGEQLPLVNVITDSIRGLTANTAPTGTESVALDTGEKIQLKLISSKPKISRYYLPADEYASTAYKTLTLESDVNLNEINDISFDTTTYTWTALNNIRMRLKFFAVEKSGNYWMVYRFMKNDIETYSAYRDDVNVDSGLMFEIIEDLVQGDTFRLEWKCGSTAMYLYGGNLPLKTFVLLETGQ